MDRFREIRFNFSLRKYLPTIRIVLPIIIVLIVIAGWLTYGWFLNITIKDNVYSTKAGISFWQKFFHFDGYRTITAAVFAFVIMIPFLIIRPRTSYLWSLLTSLLKGNEPPEFYNNVKIIVLWRIIEFSAIFVFAWFNLGFGLMHDILILQNSPSTSILSITKFFQIFINSIMWSFKNIGNPRLGRRRCNGICPPSDQG